MDTRVKILVLGAGYVGRYLQKLCEQESPHSTVYMTRRSLGLAFQFDLARPETWSCLPDADITFWLFSAEPLVQVRAFYQQNKSRLQNLVVVGTTSTFLIPQSDMLINEKSAIDHNQARAQGEDYLLSQGAKLVHSSGIYGPGRNPLDWIHQGRVGRSENLVNMIHVQDLCRILWLASQKGEPGTRYIATDGKPQSWDSIIQYWEDQGLVHHVPKRESSRPSKHIDGSWTLNSLGVTLRYPNFAKAIFDNFQTTT